MKVWHILYDMGLHVANYPTPHPTLIDIDSSSFRFAFVRHPWTWLISMWRYMRSMGWQFGALSWAADDTFEGFIEKVYKRRQPVVTPLYYTFIGMPCNRIDFVGRYESLLRDLTMALELAGYQIDRNRIMTDRGYVNASPPYPARCNSELKKIVLDAERQIIDEFYRK